MAGSKQLTSILKNLTPKRMATVESSFEKTGLSPRKGEKLFLNLKMNLDINLTSGKEESSEKTVKIITTGNANVFTGLPDAPKERRQLAECLVKIETVYQAHTNTTKEDLKKHSEFFKGQSSVGVHYALRSLVANTDFHDMPLPLPSDQYNSRKSKSRGSA